MPYRATRTLLVNQAPVPFHTGVVVVELFRVDLSTGLSAADIMEIAVVPSGCKLHRAWLASANLATALTIDVGLMSGGFGEPQDARTMPLTAEIFNDAVRNVTVPPADPIALDPIGVSQLDRGIGLRFSATEPAGVGKTLTLAIEYYKP